MTAVGAKPYYCFCKKIIKEQPFCGDKWAEEDDD